MAVHDSLAALFAELIDGPAPDAAYMLNGGDPGLLKSLDRLSAAAASAVPASGGASIAAHLDHLRYGLSLMNRWSAGEADPWSDADWTASWRLGSVSDDQWAGLRQQFAEEAKRWWLAMQKPREMTAQELNAVIGSVAHLAYHFGAIRQIDRSIRGPAAA
jgi:hypothetical protein